MDFLFVFVFTFLLGATVEGTSSLSGEVFRFFSATPGLGPGGVGTEGLEF